MKVSLKRRGNGNKDNDRSEQQDLSDGTEIDPSQGSVNEQVGSSDPRSVEDDLKEHRDVESEGQPFQGRRC